MKILRLTLKKKWFDLIASGSKTVEYREFKPYWEKRLSGKRFDEIHFRNGYAKDAPWMRVEFRGIAMVPPSGGLPFKPINGEDLTGWQFAISLGRVLETRYSQSLQETASCS